MKTFIVLIAVLSAVLLLAPTDAAALLYPPAPQGTTCWAGKNFYTGEACHFTDGGSCYGSTSWVCFESSNVHYIGNILTHDDRWLPECEHRGCTDREYYDPPFQSDGFTPIFGGGPFQIWCTNSGRGFVGYFNYVWDGTPTGQYCSLDPTLTVPAGAKYTPEQKETFRKAAVRMGAMAAASRTLAAAVPHPIWKSTLTAAFVATSGGAAWWALIAIDPPSDKYMAYAPVTVDPVTPIAAVAGVLSVAQASAFNNWQTNQAESNAVLRALSKTYDRMVGAGDANSQLWVTNQAAYYTTLRLQLADLTAADVPLRTAFCALPRKAMPADFALQFCDAKMLKLIKKSAASLRIVP